MVYDASGQPLSDSSGTSYSWNVEGLLSGFQQTGQPAYGYLYDGLGRRAEKLVNGAVMAVYLRDAQGQLVSELDGAQFTDNIISPSDGARIASVVGPGVNTIYYYHADPLGTPRAITTAAGANLMNCAQHAGQPNGSMLTYSPFGAAVGGCDQSAQPYNFTGQYRDAESTLDDFGARFYQSNLARFLSPDWSDDPEPVPYAEPGDPQSLNLYSYARNNPLGSADPDGHREDLYFDGGDLHFASDQAYTDWYDQFNGSDDVQLPAPGTSGPIYCGNLVCGEAVWTPDRPSLLQWLSGLLGRERAQTQAFSLALKSGDARVEADTFPLWGTPGGSEGEIAQIVDEAANSGAKDSRLIQIIRKLFQAGDSLPGGTAGAVRQELSTGAPTEGRFHSIKAQESINALRNLLRRGSLNDGDADIARTLIRDLEGALGGGGH